MPSESGPPQNIYSICFEHTLAKKRGRKKVVMKPRRHFKQSQILHQVEIGMILPRKATKDICHSSQKGHISNKRLMPAVLHLWPHGQSCLPRVFLIQGHLCLHAQFQPVRLREKNVSRSNFSALGIAMLNCPLPILTSTEAAVLMSFRF